MVEPLQGEGGGGERGGGQSSLIRGFERQSPPNMHRKNAYVLENFKRKIKFKNIRIQKKLQLIVKNTIDITFLFAMIFS